MTDWPPAECSPRCQGAAIWHLHNGYVNDHPVIRESTTGTIACAYSHCRGGCGFPALVLRAPALDESLLIKTGIVDELGERIPAALKAHGSMVAYGPIWQHFRSGWTGAMVDATLGPTPVTDALKRHWT